MLLQLVQRIIYPDLSESISPRSSLDLSKSSNHEESEKDKASVSKLQKVAIDSDKLLNPELVEKRNCKTIKRS